MGNQDVVDALQAQTAESLQDAAEGRVSTALLVGSSVFTTAAVLLKNQPRMMVGALVGGIALCAASAVTLALSARRLNARMKALSK